MQDDRKWTFPTQTDISAADACLDNEDKALLSSHIDKEVDHLFGDDEDRPLGSQWVCPWVPSSSARILKFIQLAGIRQCDTICDIGCGDGRVLVTCAKVIGCKGVGIDVSGECLRLAQVLAKEEGVSHLCSWIWADATSAEVEFPSEAQWLIIYMTPLGVSALQHKLDKAFLSGVNVASFVYPLGESWENRLCRVDNTLGIFIYQKDNAKCDSSQNVNGD